MHSGGRFLLDIVENQDLYPDTTVILAIIALCLLDARRQTEVRHAKVR